MPSLAKQNRSASTMLSATAAYISYLMAGTLMGFISANLFNFSARFDADFPQINLMFAIIGLGRIVVLFVSGTVADRYGPKVVLLVSMGSIGVFYAMIPLFVTLTPVLILSLLAGAGYGMVDAAATKLIFDCRFRKNNFALGLIQVFFCVGAMASPLIVPLLSAQNIFFGWQFWGFSAVCVANIFLMAVACFPRHSATRIETYDEAGAGKAVFTFKSGAFRDALFPWGVLLVFSVASSIFFLWSAVFAQENMKMTEEAAIQLPLYFNIGAVIAGVTLGRLFDKIHMTVFLMLSPAVFLACMLIFMLWQPDGLVMPLFLTAGFAAGITASYIIAIIGKLFPNNQGAASGITMSMQATGLIVTPFFTGAMYRSLGIVSVMITSCVLFALCLALTVVCRVKFRRLALVNESS